MEYTFITNSGTRDYNEDSYLTIENKNGSLFVVADGLGGHGKGEVASDIAVKTFKYSFESSENISPAFLQDVMQAAQNNILNEQQKNNEHSKMKTTCAALVIADGKCNIAHIGDSRVYVFYKNKVYYRTLDHSVPQMLVFSKEIKEKDIRKHPDRNKLLRVMGDEWTRNQYEISQEIPISKCQAFLLCSDGFWELCDEKKMCSFLKKSKSVHAWLQMMTEEVKCNGYNIDMDNFTAVAGIL